MAPTEAVEEAEADSISRALRPARGPERPSPEASKQRRFSTMSTLTSLPATPPPSSRATSPGTSTATTSTIRSPTSVATTEYGEVESGDSDFVRHKVGRSSITQQGKSTTVTTWFEDQSPGLVMAPPAPTLLPNLTIGDVFLHRTSDPDKYQLWLWCADGDSLPFWREVAVGYVREDGKVLILTEKKQQPSWVSKQYYKRIASQKEADSSQSTPKRSVKHA
ncbi:hypothetical protein OH77DRAFT_1524039 [Trametes cingulata]|nr:hypothetical protein OH77DRAFT_1524039 [Trametes cingulata]